MGKKPRQDSPRKQHHVYNRGIDKKRIFSSIPAKYHFKQCILGGLERFNIAIYAYAFMDNHMHFLLEGDLSEIGSFMRYVQGRYAYTYNLHHDREGCVFQNVYKSKPIFDDNYFQGLIRYIHMNPVKAGQCKHPGNYFFSSYQEYLSPHRTSDPLLSPLAISFYQQQFKTPQSFHDFHQKSDIILYDDIKEEVSMQMEALQNHALDTIRLYYPISQWSEALSHVQHLPDIIILLSHTYHFTPTHISKLLGVSPYHVRNILSAAAASPTSTIST